MPKSHLDDLPELRFYILSLKHSPHVGNAVWWGPHTSGYTTNLEEAGRYTREQIEARPGYYNDGKEALAVIESAAINNSRVSRFASWNSADWWRKRIKPKETADDPVNNSSDNPS